MGETEGNSAIKTDSGVGDVVTINIRSSNGSKFAVRAGLESTVGAFKTLVARNCDIPANQQRLIYKGRILKDDQTLESYGLQEEHVVHLVRGFVPDASANSTCVGTPAPVGPDSTRNIARGISSNENQEFGGGLVASLFPGLDDSTLGGTGVSGWFGTGFPVFEQVERQISRNPNMINELMNMPAMQNLVSDSGIISSIMMNNPRMHEVLNRNPELSHVLNDPNTLRQAMESARNPELMREMMRNTDRAMSNIESLPEGFNMLRRMYENVEEPLQNIASMTGNNGTGPRSNPFSALVGNQVRGQVEDLSTTPSTMGSDANSGSSFPNSNPLPNPWSSTAATRGTQTNNITRINHASGANVPGIGDFGAHGLSGIDSRSGGLIDPSMMIQLLQNPALSQMMNQLVGMDPQLRGMVDSNPEVQEPMQNPELLPSELASPERLQQSLASVSSLFASQSLQSPLRTGQTGRGAGMFD